ncbi:hypothetical protein F4778DRAFT_778407 [Xylariomycetidae sp. FL2044]|nr:hypothetical protein F4778DRAFT_778407 [Xylariomycetidae sp. FL2044]
MGGGDRNQLEAAQGDETNDNNKSNNKKPRSSKRCRVKSGCRTCKIRRVKCDEARPECRRCLLSGRVCEGYGIWGAGGNSYGATSTRYVSASKSRSQLPWYGISLAPGTVTADEQSCFEWFLRKTSLKLPGAFLSPFWDSLLLQAALAEPAVLHAVLALSSAHRRDSLVYRTGLEPHPLAPDAVEQFSLRQYGRAISHLQPHFVASSSSSPSSSSGGGSSNSNSNSNSNIDRRSLQVALLVSIVFTCLEFLLGRYTIGKRHLESGLRLLGGLQAGADLPTHDGDVHTTTTTTTTTTTANAFSLMPRHPNRQVEEWIVDAFAKLHLQGVLFNGHSAPRFYLVLRTLQDERIPIIFQTGLEAREHLDRLLSTASYIAERSFQEQTAAAPDDNAPHAPDLVERQRALESDLAAWSRAYRASRVHVSGGSTRRHHFAYSSLRVYEALAHLMARTCLWSRDETRYDAYLPQFVDLIAQCIEVAEAARTVPMTDTAATLEDLDISRSIMDRGWLPPIYWTALKCRNRALRRRALAMLPYHPHREGIWESELTAAIAGKVVEVEEGGGNEVQQQQQQQHHHDELDGDINNDNDDDDYDHESRLFEPPRLEDLGPTTLPESCRMHDVQIELPDDSRGQVTLTCRRKRDDGSWFVFRSVYDPGLGQWKDDNDDDGCRCRLGTGSGMSGVGGGVSAHGVNSTNLTTLTTATTTTTSKGPEDYTPDAMLPVVDETPPMLDDTITAIEEWVRDSSSLSPSN